MPKKDSQPSYRPGWSDYGIPRHHWNRCDAILKIIDDATQDIPQDIIDTIVDELHFRRQDLPKRDEKFREWYLSSFAKR